MIDTLTNSISISAIFCTSFLNLLSNLLQLGFSFVILMHALISKFSKEEIWQRSAKFFLKFAKINFGILIISFSCLLFELGFICFECIEYITTALGPIILCAGIAILFIIPIAMNILTRKSYLFANIMLFLASVFLIYCTAAINTWLSNPNGIEINYINNKIFLIKLENIIFNNALVMKFLHLFAASMIFTMGIIISICSYYLLKNINIAFSLKTIKNSTYFILIFFVLATFSGNQKMLEMQKTHPVKFIAMIDLLKQTQPYINQIIIGNKQRIKEGIQALNYLKILKNNPEHIFTNEEYDEYTKFQSNIPFAWLIPECITQEKLVATSFMVTEPLFEEISEEQIALAAKKTIPKIKILSYAFLFMLITSIIAFLIYILLSIKLLRNSLKRSKFFLRFLIIIWPLNLITIFAGWLITISRTPWAIHQILPSYLAMGKLTNQFAQLTLAIIPLFFFVLLIIKTINIMKIIKHGPIYEIKADLANIHTQNKNIQRNILPKNFYKHRLHANRILKTLKAQKKYKKINNIKKEK